jgi:hypothetical protein
MTGTEQRLGALAVANERRVAKAEMKREWRELEQHVLLRRIAGLLEDKPEVLASFRIEEMLKSVNGIGPTKMKDLARAAEWAEPSWRVAKLTDRQRRLLAQVLRDRANHAEARHASAA